MPATLIDANLLNAGLEVPVGPEEVFATVCVSSLTGGAWSNAAFAVQVRVAPGGPWVNPVGGAVSIAAADNNVPKRVTVAGCVAVRVVPTIIETTGGSATAYHVLASISLARGAVNVSV